MPRTATQITASMIQTLLSTTSLASNFNQGSLIRSILDANAAADALLEQQAVDLGAQNILNAIYDIWNITPLPPIASVYQLQFTNSNTTPQAIAQQTQVQIPNSSLIWYTQSAVTIPAQTGGINGVITVNAICSVTGLATNVPVNTITSLVVPITGVTVTNPSATALIAGADVETQTQTQARAANFVATIHRGDNAAIEAGILQNGFLTNASGSITEQVIKVQAVDYSAGQVYVYAVNGSNGAVTLSSAMISFIAQILYGYTDSSGIVHTGYKAGGIVPTIQQAVLNPLPVSIQVLPQSNTTLALITTPLQTAISTFFLGLDIEQSYSLGNFMQALLAVPGVADVLVISPPSSLVGIPLVVAPTSAPTLAPIAGSTALSSGTYYVSYTFTTAWGETTPSPQASVAISATNQIQVSAITLPVGATAINYYLSKTVGSTTVEYDTVGTGAIADLTALPLSIAVTPPVVNGALIHGNLYTVSGTPAIAALAV